jgi:hypothetical protein
MFLPLPTNMERRLKQGTGTVSLVNTGKKLKNRQISGHWGSLPFAMGQFPTATSSFLPLDTVLTTFLKNFTLEEGNMVFIQKWNPVCFNC